RSGTRQGCPLSPLLFNIVLEVLASAIRQQKEIKGIRIGKEEVKLSLFTDDMILYIENPTDSTRSLLELIHEFSKLQGTKSSLFLCKIRLCLLIRVSFGAYSWTAQPLQCWNAFYQFLFGKNKRIKDGAQAWVGFYHIAKFLRLVKTCKTCDSIPIQIPESYFVDFSKLIIKFTWRGKKHLIAKVMWEKNKMGRQLLLAFKTSYKAAAIKTVWYWQKNRQIDQCSRIESSEIDPHKWDNGNLTKKQRQYNRRDHLLNKWC
ncbi:LORF2 protein, partial [Crocuta crocuta]